MSATTGKASPPASLTRRSVSLGSPVGRWLTATSAPSDGEAHRRCLADAGGRAGDERDLARRSACSMLVPPVCRLQKIAIGFQGEPVAPGQAQRQADDHELQAPLLLAGLGQLLELQAVGDAHAHRRRAAADGSGRACPRRCSARSRRRRRAGTRRCAARASTARCRRAARPCPRRPAGSRCSRRRAPGGARGGRCGRPGCRPRRAGRPPPSRSPRARRGSPPRPARASRPRDGAPRRAARRGRRCRSRRRRCCPSRSRARSAVAAGLPL